MFPELSNFSKEKQILLQELPKRGYRIWVFYVAKILADFPINILNPLLFVPCLYFLGPFNHTFEAFLIFLGISILLMQSSIVFSHIFTAFTPSFEIGQVTMVPFMLLLTLYSGVYLNIESIPSYLHWISKVSMIHWGFGGFAIK